MAALSDAEIDDYRRDGFHFPVPVLSAAEAAVARTAVEAFEAGCDGGRMSAGQRYKLHLILPWLYDLVRHPRILEAVSGIVGPDVLVWNSTFFIKEACDPSFVGWHQDMAYWGLEPPEVVTAWIAFTDSTVENGAMRIIPGSFAPQAHRDTYAKLNMLSRGQELSATVDAHDAIDMVLTAGEAALFDARLVHGSEPNRSNDRRIGLAIRYIAPHVRQRRDPGVAARSQSEVAVLGCGEDRFGHYILAPRPRFDLDPEALALHARNT